ncbi:hypothetical protein CYMTET_17055 [Cymbomonas tetramitiformis]|uniref:Uncharacterized protein n=1 Tax=Cymbomonas tetramitiformis TaxID=36881 RepID=A0AAE0GAP1_9CHLO|nr:hypothetical protein CYMTET_17055 [Cymbomonas tetramitiformis]
MENLGDIGVAFKPKLCESNHYAGGEAAAAAILISDDCEAKQLLKVVVDELWVLEHYIRSQKGGAPPALIEGGSGPTRRLE